VWDLVVEFKFLKGNKMKELKIEGISSHGCYELSVPANGGDWRKEYEEFISGFAAIGLEVRAGLGGCVVQPVEGSDWTLVEEGCSYQTVAVDEDGDFVYTEVAEGGYNTVTVNKAIWESISQCVRVIITDTIEYFD
jgi:hypothetical protein